MKKHKRTTITKRVEEFLRESDDFKSYRELLDHVMSHDDVTISNITAACCHLKQHKVIDFVVDNHMCVWWYALPPDLDDRSRVVEKRVVESRPRRRRRRITIVIHHEEEA